jgi:type II secretory pathway pseudopilin PulG
MNRAAFTRTELVVVIAIICVLGGLMLPGIEFQHVSARRHQCVNNLKQIAIACLNHESSTQVLPNSGYDSGKAPNLIPTFLGGELSPATGDRQQAGWSYQILPYLSQMMLWEGGQSTSLAEKQAVAALGTPSPYYCSARRRPTRVNGRGLIDYAAASTCSGLLADFADPTVDLGRECAIVRNRNTLADIIAGEVSTYSINKNGIRDGSSNVMLISEKQMNDCVEPPTADDDQGYCVGHDIDNMRTCIVPPQKDYCDPKEGLGGGSRIYRFGSSHPGVIVVAMCDGSTRIVNFNIDQQTFFNLGRRRDGAKLAID